MTHKHNTFEEFGLPGHVAEVLFTLSLILTLAPYFSGDFGLFKIPVFSEATRSRLKGIGPTLFVTTLVLFYPFWPDPAASVRSAGGKTQVDVVFMNQSNRQVDLDWLDYNGQKNEEIHQSLEPDEEQTEKTFVGHAWSFSDANTGEILRTVIIKKHTKSESYPRMSFVTLAKSPFVFAVVILILILWIFRWFFKRLVTRP